MAKIVVTGATGNIGRSLVRALADAAEQVTAVSRHPDEIAEDVEHRRGDLADPESLRSVADGADALFLLIAGAGEGLSPGALVGAAKAGEVHRITLLSSQAAGTRPDAASHAQFRAFEAAVQGSGLGWTILRPGGLASNAFIWADVIRAERTMTAPFGDVGLPIVDPADVADVAAIVLRDQGDGHRGRTYTLTGPALVTPRQQARTIGETLGTPVRFVDQTPQEARAQMLQFMPEVVVDSTLSILGDPLPDEQQVSPHVERLLGRPARPFTEWAARNTAAFR